MRILYVVSRYPTLSTTFVLQEITLMHALGHEIQVCSFRPPGRAEADTVAAGGLWIAPTQQAPKTVGTLVDTVRARLPEAAGGGPGPAPWRELMAERLAFGGLGRWVATVARAFAADYIHAHFANVAATAAWAAARASGIPFGFTAHAHDIFEKANPWLGPKTRAALLPVTISEFHRQFLIDRLGPDVGGRFQVVRCGVDLATFTPRAGAPTHDISAVGRLVEKKGFDVLLQALALLPKPRPSCRIVGEGPMRGALERMVEDLDLGECVHLLGARPHSMVREVVQGGRLFVLPCRIAGDGDRDGLPVVLMEALALAKPAISTAVAGVPELIVDGQTGVLTASGRADELAAAIARLLADPEEARRLGSAGRAHVEAHFDVRANTVRLAEQIAAIVRPERSSPNAPVASRVAPQAGERPLRWSPDGT